MLLMPAGLGAAVKVGARRTGGPARPVARQCLAAVAPARVRGHAVGEREAERVAGVQCVHRRELRGREAARAGVAAARADDRGERRVGRPLAAAVVADHAVGDAVERVAGTEHGLVHQVDLGAEPCRADLVGAARLVAEGLQAAPVHHGVVRDDRVEVVRIALRHHHPFAPALRAAAVVALGRLLAVVRVARG